MFGLIRRHLSVKLFISYLAVILVGTFVMAGAAELVIPQSFNRHMANMTSMMSGGSMGMDLDTDLFSGFRAAVNEALIVAVFSAFVAAAIASVFVSRQVVAPVQQMTAASQRMAQGHFEERVQVSADLSLGDPDELGQLALSFNRMAAQLEHVEQQRRQLIGDVAHELRTPLTTIKGSMEGLIDGVLPAVPETYQQIHREADRLQRLVQDLQELSQFEAGAFELNLRPARIEDLLEAAVASLHVQYRDKGVSLKLAALGQLPAVRADRDRIGQVLLNLLGNALQHTRPGGTVEISAKLERNELFVRVSDNGVGIPIEHLPHLFTRFYRVDKSRSRAAGGSGIGLTIAKYLVEAHGGRIWAESAGPGLGSSFTFTLPAS